MLKCNRGRVAALIAVGCWMGVAPTARAEGEAPKAEATAESQATPAAAVDPAAPAAPPASDTARIDDLEEKVDILAEEIGRLESVFAVPEELALVSYHGLGPAASKVYKKDGGLSIGGYGENRIRTFHNTGDDDRDNVYDQLRAVLYVGYKFNENWVLNSEIEYEHGGNEVAVEFLTVDYLWLDELNFRAGNLLVPMGFVNEIHEPNFFFGAERPEVERTILPSTWHENGAGIWGTIAGRIEYRAYAINGFDGQSFTSSGLRGGRQGGAEAIANDFAFVGRVDVDVVTGLMIGGSVYTGQSGQEQTSDASGTERDVPDAQTTIYELHAQYKGYGASLRALWTEAFVDEAGRLSRVLDLGATSAIAQQMRGWYLEAAYNVMPLFFEAPRMSLEPYFRFERYDTQREVSDLGFDRDRTKDVDLYVAGIQFKPIPQIVFKLDFRHFDLARTTAAGSRDRADEVQGLVGYVF
ncbi:MAG: hypothetical protein IPK00_23975 [Deltaproteobacteria bacterium]|nr:hypothetical protein [Deltaproteobacteria bacterium]